MEWQKSTQRLSSIPERKNGNINLSNIINISSPRVGNRIHNQSILQSHFVPLRRDWPQIKMIHAENNQIFHETHKLFKPETTEKEDAPTSM